MTTVSSRPSDTFQAIEKFMHRDDRGGDIKHNGLPSKPVEHGVQQLWRRSPGWPDKNGDARTDVTYEFRTPPADPKAMKNKRTGFTHILDNQRQQVRLSLQSIEDVANVRFTEGPKTQDSEGHITIGNYEKKLNAEGNLVDGNSQTYLPESGDVWFWNSPKNRLVPYAALGSRGRRTIIHELGHAMGLEHPGNYNAKVDKSKFVYHEDSRSHTVMSYRDERTDYMNYGGFDVSAPQLDDIAAYQHKYGANHETRKDDTTYGFNSNTDRDFLSVKSPKDKIVAAIWDGGGNDTLDFSGYTQDQQISLKAGTFSDVGGLKGNVSIAYGATIENAMGGSGNDLLVGNEEANTLKGGAGNDRLYGAAGADKLWGGQGKDVFVYGHLSESNHAAPDQIMDFSTGVDRVDVSGITASLGTGALKFVKEFSGASGEAIIDHDPITGITTLQITGKPEDSPFILIVHGNLQPGDIIS